MLTAKGRRKNGSINSERLLGSMAMNYSNGVDGDMPDLVEEDVWSTMNNAGGNDESRHERYGHSERNSDERWRTGGGNRRVGGLSLAFEDEGRSYPRVIHQFRSSDDDHGHDHHSARHHSAPMSVPDWPKILRVDSSDTLRSTAAGELEFDDGEWMPPHEYLARENAASGKRVATSVFEGVGRTLKGRDMSRVRNTVWRQTGFFG